MCCKGKKSQYYIFGGIILISAVFLIISSSSSISLSKQEDSEAILDNYIYEAKIVIDNSIMKNLNTSEALANYTEKFIEYGESRNLKLGIAYMFSEDGNIHIRNYLDGPVNIVSEGVDIFPGEESVFRFSNDLQLKYRNDTYNYIFSHPDKTEFKTFLVKKDE